MKGIHFESKKIKKFILILKLVSSIFYESFVFSLNGSPSKTMKNDFYSIEEAFLFFEIFKFL